MSDHHYEPLPAGGDAFDEESAPAQPPASKEPVPAYHAAFEQPAYVPSPYQQGGAPVGTAYVSYQSGGFGEDPSAPAGHTYHDDGYGSLMASEPTSSYGALPNLMGKIQGVDGASCVHNWFRRYQKYDERAHEKPWIFPVILSLIQLVMTILLMPAVDTIFMYIVGSLAIIPHLLGTWAIYQNTSLPEARRRRATNSPLKVVIFDIRYNAGVFLYDIFKFLHIAFCYCVCFASIIGILLNATGGTRHYGWHVIGSLVFWLIGSGCTAALAVHYRRNELLFRWIWQEIVNAALADLQATRPGEVVKNHLSSILKIDEYNKFLYEPAAEAPEEERHILPSVADEQSVEIYRMPNAVCGCIQDGETMLDINSNRITGATVSGWYPCSCGNLKHLTMWFEHLPSTYLQTGAFQLIPDGFSTFSMLCGVPWLLACGWFCNTNHRFATLTLPDPAGSAIHYPVHMYHAPSIRNVLVRALGAWRAQRLLHGGGGSSSTRTSHIHDV